MELFTKLFGSLLVFVSADSNLPFFSRCERACSSSFVFF